MSYRAQLGVKIASALVAAAVGLSPARAAPMVVGVATDFGTTPYSFTVDGSTFTFSGTGDIFNPTAIGTGGGAAVNSFGGFLGIPVEPTTNFVNRGTVTFGPGMPFAAFPGGATIPYSNGDNFVGLRATLNGLDYYGYAFTTDTVLNGYAFETVANTAITASTAVPEPGTWVMMGGAFALIGCAMRRRRTVAIRFA